MNTLYNKEKTLYIPTSNEPIDRLDDNTYKTDISSCHELKTNSSVVIIGANGTGKTRLGAWMDLKSPIWKTSLRISAQKSLVMPSSVQPKSSDEALRSLIYGYENGDADYKIHNRWNDKKSATHFLNDFDKLMVYLFSEEMEENAKYTHSSRNSTEKIPPPITKLSILKDIWESLLPHRELVVGGAKIETRVKEGNTNLYNSSDMSDGERVIFYLIGACLSAPENGVIIIDEPEIHIHKSLQYPLWNKLENIRNDCLFVYITHDVDFASSQTDAKKLWLKNFDGRAWEWQELSKEDDFPEDLLFEIMGSRRKVIFVEGESGSHDISLYRILFPEHLIIPRGGCTKVISDIKTLRKLPNLHHLDTIGIIDRDRRVDDEIMALENNGIYVLPVAEIENLFCTEEIVSFCCDLLSRDYGNDIEEIKKEIFKSFNGEIENQLCLRVISEVKFRLNALDEKGQNLLKVKENLNNLTNNINIDDIYSSFDDKFKIMNQDKNYRDLLKYYNRKSLKDKVGKILGVTDLPSLIIRTAASENNADKIKDKLKPYFKHIPGY